MPAPVMVVASNDYGVPAMAACGASHSKKKNSKYITKNGPNLILKPAMCLKFSLIKFEPFRKTSPYIKKRADRLATTFCGDLICVLFERTAGLESTLLTASSPFELEGCVF